MNYQNQLGALQQMPDLTFAQTVSCPVCTTQGVSNGLKSCSLCNGYGLAKMTPNGALFPFRNE